MNGPRNTILQGDSLALLKTLPDGCVQTCVTSPPYWGLRDYGVPGQIGLEETPSAYVARMVELFAEVRRILRDDGTAWINMGDSYANDGISGWQGKNGQRAKRRFTAGGMMAKRGDNLKPKDLCGVPWRLAFALQDDGWWLRSDIIWAKPNPMPESVTDRPTRSHEYIFLLTKQARYYYDAEAIREEHTAPFHKSGPNALRGQVEIRPRGNLLTIDEQSYNSAGRNKRTVWTVATHAFPGAHFATFPPALIEPCILAGSRPGDLVLDPFMGAGTTAIVAVKHSRHYLGIELNPDYIDIANRRLARGVQMTLQEDMEASA